MKHLKNPAAFLGLLFLLFVLSAAYFRHEFHSMKQQLNVVSETTEKMNAGIGYNLRRKKIVLALYEKIIESNPRLPKDLAFKIADYDYYVSKELYKSFSPFLLFAIQWKETGGQFEPSLVSPAGATGLNQMMPLTAKFITKAMRVEWSDDLLTDPYRNTDMAAFYLDYLFAQLKDPKLVLAYYNGGESQYRHMKNGNPDSLCSETSNYIKSVLAYAEKLEPMEDIKDFNLPSITDSVRVETKKIKKIDKPKKIVVDSSSDIE